MPTNRRVMGARGTQRVAAFAIDYAVIAAYIGLLTGLGFVARAALHQRLALPRADAEEPRGHAAAFPTLTLPVALYFALSQAAPPQATPGTRARGLRVTTTEGGRVPLGRSLRSLVRSAVKVAPWEAAHTALWHTPGRPFVLPPTAWYVAGYAVAPGGAARSAAALFIGSRRTLYDHIAGTTVMVGEGRTAHGETTRRGGSMSEDEENRANAQARDRREAREGHENAERAEARERVRTAQEREKQQREQRPTASRKRAAHGPPPPRTSPASDPPAARPAGAGEG